MLSPAREILPLVEEAGTDGEAERRGELVLGGVF